MKVEYLNIDEMSDSSEVYNTRPHPFFRIFIYSTLIFIIIVIVWSNFFKIENTVKVGGIIEKTENNTSISNKTDGYVKAVYVKDKDVVKKGDKLYEIDNTAIIKSIDIYKDTEKDYRDRLSVLNGYLLVLKGESKNIDAFKDNPYYDEYENRIKLFKSSTKLNAANAKKENSSINASVSGYKNSIKYNSETIEKLNEFEKAITSRKNTFDKSEPYYYNSVKSYINKYDSTSDSYDTQIDELKKNGGDTNEIKKLETEKINALDILESETISNIQKDIESLKSNNTVIQNNINSAKSSYNNTYELDEQNLKFTEINSVYTEIDTLNSKIKEIENNINSLQMDLDNTVVKATIDGTINLKTDLVVGNTITSGTLVCSIIPNSENLYKITAYIDSSKIGKVKKDQITKTEISSYPRDDYGLFNGKIVNVSDDIKITSEQTGVSYYIAEIQLENKEHTNKQGEIARLKEGMECDVKIVTGEESVMRFFLKKIHLVD